MRVSFFIFMFLAHGPDGDDSKKGKGCDFKKLCFKNGCKDETDEKSENNVEDFIVFGSK